MTRLALLTALCAMFTALLVAERTIAGVVQCHIAPVEGCPR